MGTYLFRDANQLNQLAAGVGGPREQAIAANRAFLPVWVAFYMALLQVSAKLLGILEPNSADWRYINTEYIALKADVSVALQDGACAPQLCIASSTVPLTRALRQARRAAGRPAA